MSRRRLALIVFVVIEATGAAMLSASLVGAIYGEWRAATLIAITAGVIVIVGEFGRRLVGGEGELSTREAFAAVGISWLAMTAIGTLPFLVTGALSNLTDAFFEASAGFSTTASSVIDPSELDHAVLWWRSLTQWMGAAGIIFLSVAALPVLGIGRAHQVPRETHGQPNEPIRHRTRHLAERLAVLYLGFTVIEALLLVFSDMDVFEAITHSFATMSTGGFGTRADSLASFSPYAQWVAVTFMLVAGTSFALHLRELRKPTAYQRSAELRLYGLIVGGAALLLVWGRWSGGVGDAVREGVFSAVSIVTTTGFTNSDLGAWAPGLQIVLVVLMFTGGMAGSASGSINTYRLAVLANASRTGLRRLIHPLGVFRSRMGGTPVDDAVVHSVQAFFLLYMLAFVVGTLLLGVIQSGLGAGETFLTAVSGAASALGNIGPGLGAVGPTETYAAVPTAGKWVLSSLMIVGRLGIFPVVLLLTPELWRR
jgi:trk system potassium uptake protein TrkH